MRSKELKFTWMLTRWGMPSSNSSFRKISKAKSGFYLFSEKVGINKGLVFKICQCRWKKMKSWLQVYLMMTWTDWRTGKTKGDGGGSVPEFNGRGGGDLPLPPMPCRGQGSPWPKWAGGRRTKWRPRSFGGGGKTPKYSLFSNIPRNWHLLVKIEITYRYPMTMISRLSLFIPLFAIDPLYLPSRLDFTSS